MSPQPEPARGLTARAADYLEFRHSMGFELDRTGYLVRGFARHCDSTQITRVTIEAVLDWVLAAGRPDTTYRWQRLNAARGFASWLHALDPAHQVPPADLVPRRNDRPAPCIMTGEQIQVLMDTAGQLRPPLHAATMQTLIGLMAATGMRGCEAFRADDADIDTAAAVMTLHGKKARERLIPLHPTTLDALTAYQQLRGQLLPGYAGPGLLANICGNRPDPDLTRMQFTRLVDTAGLGNLTPRPTLRALRHTFAVTTLTAWLDNDADTQTSLPLLSAYLGHAKPRHTYDYLQAVPALLQAASDHMLRAAARAGATPPAP